MAKSIILNILVVLNCITHCSAFQDPSLAAPTESAPTTSYPANTNQLILEQRGTRATLCYALRGQPIVKIYHTYLCYGGAHSQP